jgi:hypothetical protein
LPDSLAGFFSRNQAAFVGGLHSLLQDTAGCRTYLNYRLVANKRIDALGLSHTFTVASIGGECNRIQFIHSWTAPKKPRLSPENRGEADGLRRSRFLLLLVHEFAHATGADFANSTHRYTPTRRCST